MKTRQPQRNARRAGFSLAELMVVIVIIMLLATLVVPNVMGQLFRGQVGKAIADISQIDSACKQYAIANQGTYPASLEELVTPDSNGFRYLDMETVPKDPWGTEYQYEPPLPGSNDPRIFTLGADKVPGGEGKDRDITNIMIKNGELD